MEEAQIDDHLRQAVRPHMDALGQSLSTLTTRVDQGLTEMSGAVKELSRAEGGAVGGAAGGVEAMETGEGTDINRQLSTLEQKVNLFEQVSDEGFFSAGKENMFLDLVVRCQIASLL